MKKSALLLLGSVFVLIFAFGCKSSDAPESRNVEKLYQDATELFQKGEYLESKKLFDLIKLQYPASQYADDAQYYLAEVEYKKERYIMAAFNYNLVRKYYPNSPYVVECLYKAALCYSNLAPQPERDQDYTKKAIQSFMEFQTYYPNDTLYHEAGKQIEKLRNILAEKEFKNAVLYTKMNNPKAAVIYYDAVINDYEDTQFYQDAFFGKIESLIVMSKKEEAKTLIDLYKQKFPSGKFIASVNEISSKLK